MKKYLSPHRQFALLRTRSPAFAQFGHIADDSQFDGTMAKLFGDNSPFTAAVETQIEQKIRRN